MNFFWSKFALEKFRWLALVFLSLSLAIVVIDNSVLNVAIPYILRDLNTSFDAIQWVISGYALIIATVLITVGRLGDIIGRKKVFLIGIVLFAIGSFTASVSQNALMLFFGESFIEAIGAAMMLTSSLSLLTTEFKGRERALAFGVWGSVAGASATIGPLLGGYLTTNYSWRWSLRINVFVAIIAILGSVFIQEAYGEGKKRFDWLGTLFSGIGLFGLVFGFIEGENYGWWTPNKTFSIGGWNWPISNLSIIPIAFAIGIISLFLFVIVEFLSEKRGGSPLLKMSMFKSRGFSLGLLTLVIVMLGQFGIFFILPIYLQNVLGLDAFGTGIVFLPMSLAIAVSGPVSGIIASKIGPKWIVSIGMFVGAIGTYWLSQSVTISASGWSLSPALVLFGLGIGMTGAQLTNLTLSSVSSALAGEASAANSAIRQVGTSIGIAIIGVVLSSVLSTKIVDNIKADPTIPSVAQNAIVSHAKNISAESGQKGNYPQGTPQQIVSAVSIDVDHALVDASRASLRVAMLFVFVGAIVSLFIPNLKQMSWEEINKQNAAKNAGQKAPVEPLSVEDKAVEAEIRKENSEESSSGTIFSD